MRCRKLAPLFLASSSLVLTLVLAGVGAIVAKTWIDLGIASAVNRSFVGRMVFEQEKQILAKKGLDRYNTFGLKKRGKAVVMLDRTRQLGKISIARTSPKLTKTNCDDKNNGCYEEDPRRFVNPHSLEDSKGDRL